MANTDILISTNWITVLWRLRKLSNAPFLSYPPFSGEKLTLTVKADPSIVHLCLIYILIAAHEPLDHHHTLNSEAKNSDRIDYSVEKNVVVTKATGHAAVIVDHAQYDIGEEA